MTLPPGVTYRQLDYWARAGLICPSNGEPGSGHGRDWPPHELEVAAIIGELRELGFDLTTAARLARDFAEGRTTINVSQRYLLVRLVRP